MRSDVLKVLKNSLWNFAGLIVPLLFLIVSTPVIIENIGNETFALLTFVWLAFGYVSVFDLGVSRTVTIILSSMRGGAKGEYSESDIVGAALGLVLFLSVVIGAFVFVINWIFLCFGSGFSWLVVFIFCFSVPVLLLSSVLKGVVESFSLFRYLSITKVPLSFFNYALPAFLSFYYSSISAFLLCVLAGRVLVAFAMLKKINFLIGPVKVLVHGKCWGFIFSKSSSIALTNIFNPLIGYADRFVIAFLVSLAAVTYYVTPYELITKLWLFPAALSSVLIPYFAQGELSEGKKKVFGFSVLLTALFMGIVCSFIFLFSYEFMSIWISIDFAEKSFFYLRVFSVGMFFSCVAYIPFSFIQSMGGSVFIARSQLIQLPFYVFFLYWSVVSYGLSGLAVIWLVRIVLDSFLLSGFSMYLMRRC